MKRMAKAPGSSGSLRFFVALGSVALQRAHHFCFAIRSEVRVVHNHATRFQRCKPDRSNGCLGLLGTSIILDEMGSRPDLQWRRLIVLKLKNPLQWLSLHH